jgi:hydrogenase maturation protein HypF
MQATLQQRKIAGDETRLRLRVTIRGAVQGVGFRPFIFRLASELGLSGWVSNSRQGVVIEVEGNQHKLENFLLYIDKEKPPRAFIQSLESSFLDPIGYASFEIRQSEDSGEKTALVLPDIATCPDCLREIFDPANRRYRYPFTNCTNCGPRFTIIESLPYDRPNTTMKSFAMCLDCRAEYHNPANRRFHAQPNACPSCGPWLELWDHEGLPLAAKDEAVFEAADALLRGKIVAVKGIGGFHLMVAACNAEAVQRLRQRKHREEKPLALMYPNLELVKTHCEVAPFEERLLLSPEAPIVLLRRKNQLSVISDQLSVIASSVAPRNPFLGIMLPYTPLHHLLLAELGLPVVATSGNLSDEPICIDEREALQRLGGIADMFLVHNRLIARHVDDSIVRVMIGRELVLRRGRGYAPLPIHLKEPIPPLLAVGAHLKNTIALSIGKEVFVSQHIGDLETTQAYEAFRKVIGDFEQLYEVRQASIACDLHPEYLSTKFAQQLGTTDRLLEQKNNETISNFQRPFSDVQKKMQVISIQHHFAHVVACMAENELEGSVLGVSWDGTGYGLDGTIWGGEFFRATTSAFERVAHFRAFRLPGGEKAIKEPRRIALGLLYELFGGEIFAMKELAPVQAFSAAELALLQNLLAKNFNAPFTSSAGRLFDAVAAILDLRQQTKFEGQAAMELEFALDGVETDESYPLLITDYGIQNDLHTRTNGRIASRQQKSAAIIDWASMIKAILNDVQSGISVGMISAKFHNTLVEAIIAVAQRVSEERVVLTGGCFQNKYLTERAIYHLREKGFHPYWHQRIPPNDGGIALGQAFAAAKSQEYGLME